MAKYVLKWTKAFKGGYEYGFNVNLFINGKKIKDAHTKGGGYDMEGQVWLNYLRATYPNTKHSLSGGNLLLTL